MERVSVTYRQKEYFIDIDTSKPTIDLKKALYELIGIKDDRFSLKFKAITLDDHKKISFYTKDGHNFQMINVSIDVCVVFNGVNHDYYVPELRRIDQFIEDVLRLSGHDTEISLYYKDKKLSGLDTFVSSGVEHGATLTAVNGKRILNITKEITVFYRDKWYPIRIEQTKTVLQLKELISNKTHIKVNNFCLKQDLLFLIDECDISKYTKWGTAFTMENVTIEVIVIVNGQEVQFWVNERVTIEDFIKEIISKQNISGNMYLNSKNGTLVDTKTVLECNIEDGCILLAVLDGSNTGETQEVTVTYRYHSNSINVNTATTVADLKESVAGIYNIVAENFSLCCYWLLLDDTKHISEYIKYGTKYSMTDVTIKITVALDGRLHGFAVREDMKVRDLKALFNERLRMDGDMLLYCNNQPMNDEATMLSCEVEHNGFINAVATIYGG